MSLPHLEKKFPNLANEGYTKTSDATPQYNCVGYVLDDDTRWWEPGPVMGYKAYWPAPAARQNTVKAFELVFGLYGFRRCKDGSVEEGFDKIALYQDSKGRPAHAARMLPSGEWTSKLGRDVDIDHPTLKALEDSEYGKARYFFKRQIKAKYHDDSGPK